MLEPDVTAPTEPHRFHGQTGFDRFYRLRRPDLVRALVLAVGDAELGREAADEAFTRAVERWPEVSTYDNPEGWIYRVGLNWARSRQRRRKFEVGTFLDDPVGFDDTPDVVLLEAVESLSLKYRAVVVARFFLDWSVEQTAIALEIPEGTVKTRQARALRRLRHKLGDPNDT